ncbi:MAG: hypothetical protein ACP5KN_01440 [Armatimonadota bacterium]
MALLEWYNLIFVAPVGLAGVYLLLSATGIGDLTGETDVDTDVDADLDHDVDLDMDHDVDLDMDHDVDVAMDHDVDLDMDHDVDVGMDHDLDVDHDLDMAHEVDVDHDVELGHDVEMDHDVEVDHEVGVGHDADVGHDVEADHDLQAQHEATVHAHEPSMLLRALSVLGFGKVPLSILGTCLMVLFGATGLIANGLFEHLLPWDWAPTVYVWPSLALAVLSSLTLTGSVARGLHRIMPTRETYAVGPEDLVGRVGVPVYGIRDGSRGVVHVKDESGTLHQVMGRSLEGSLAKGAEVILVRYHVKGDYYDLTASPL